MRVPWTARRSNQSTLEEINPEYSSEGLKLKLKLQYFGHLMRRVDLLEKTLMLGGIGGRRRKEHDKAVYCLPGGTSVTQPRTDAFKLWCWRRLSRVPWTAMRSNQSILKEINS